MLQTFNEIELKMIYIKSLTLFIFINNRIIFVTNKHNFTTWDKHKLQRIYLGSVYALQSRGGLKCDDTLVASFGNDLHQSIQLHNYPSVNMQYLYYESVDFNKI